MKQAASCKHRQAVKFIQCEKKLFRSYLHSSKLVKRAERNATSTNQKMAARMESFFVRLLFKTEIEMGFLTVTSSWGYQHSFLAETSQFLSNTTYFYDCVANNLMNF